MAMTLSYVEVAGNEAADRRKVAERAVLSEQPDAKIISSGFWGRASSGAPVFWVEWIG